MLPEPPKLRAAVVIDYQNVHLTARDIFEPGQPPQVALIEPSLFARAAVQERNKRQRKGHPLATVVKVFVARGLPHTDHEREQNARCTAQAEQWRSQGAEVYLRDLKYDYERDASGRPIKDINGKTTPKGRGREKGIDVACAVRAVRLAVQPTIDVVLLASRDTDLVPVLDEIYDMRGIDPATVAAVETLTWDDRTAALRLGSLRPSGNRRIWNTNLDRRIFEASRDRRAY